jgi:hypothetical protein
MTANNPHPDQVGQAAATVPTEKDEDFDLVEELDRGLDPSKVLAFLLTGTERFTGEKDIVLAAFQAWVLFPTYIFGHPHPAVTHAVMVRFLRKIERDELRYA